MKIEIIIAVIVAVVYGIIGKSLYRKWRDNHAKRHTEYEITTSRNIPKNLLEEAQIATMLEGVASKETQLNTLSIVKDASAEIEKLKEEEQNTLDPVMDRTFGGDKNEPVLER